MNHTLRVFALSAGLALGAACAYGQDLNHQIETSLANRKLAGARIGVSVVDLETGRELADLRDEEPLIPASNMKLLTSGAAMLVLGKDFVFRTELILDGTRLVIRGAGDPALGDPFVLEDSADKLTVDGLVSMLARAVKLTDAASVSEIIVDDRVFDRQSVHPSWPADQLDKTYCAEVSGLNFHMNVVSLFPAPSPQGMGRAPVYTIEPSVPWLEVENKARTVAGSKNTVSLVREPGTNRLSMLGEVGIPTRIPVEITLRETAVFAGRVLAAELPRTGVGVGPVSALASPELRLNREQAELAFAKVRLAGADEVLSGRTIAVVTTSIGDVLERCNGDSQNLYAECLFKRMGHEVTREPGSWANGASVLRMTLAEPPPKGLGPAAAATTQIADGSGLSRENRVAPRTLTRWLDRLQGDSAVGAGFVNSLASPLVKESLKRRFRDKKLVNDLRAKSGTIDGVRCLSGYLTDPQSGRRIAFSVMVNNIKEGDQLEALDFHEDVVMIADKWLAARRPSRSPAATVPQLGGDR